MNKKATSYQGRPTLEVLEGANKYNTWIAETFLPYIKPPILEIGSGIGNITKHFHRNTPIVITEIDEYFLKTLIFKFNNFSDVKVRTFDITQKPSEEFIQRFSTVLCINVLEHIENDVHALENIKKTLRKNGRLLMLVPAKKKAYTRLDKELGHFRRYEKNEIIEKLKKTGFALEKIYFFNLFGLITWIVRDKITQNKKIHLQSYQISLFDMIVPILKRIESRIKIPIGISLIIIAKNEDIS